MAGHQLTLTAQEIETLRFAIRAGRVLAVLGAAVAVPLLIELLAPVVGVVLLALVFLSPVLVTAGLVMAARRPAGAPGQPA